MRKLYEDIKMDLGVLAQTLNNTNVTGRYFSAKHAHRILVLLNAGAMLKTKTTKIELLQATDMDGASAKGIPTTAAQAALATIAANVKVTQATITLATFLVDGVITINGLVFTAHATVTTLANREFSISGNDTADAVELCLCINDPTYGVPGVTASSALGVVTLISTEPGETVISISSVPEDGTCVLATVEAQAFVEIQTDKLDWQNDFKFVAAKVTTTADTVIAVSMIAGQLRYMPVPKMAASAAP